VSGLREWFEAFELTVYNQARDGEISHEVREDAWRELQRIAAPPSPWRPIAEAWDRFGPMVEFVGALRVVHHRGTPREWEEWQRHIIEIDDETGQISTCNRDDCGWTLADFELCAPLPAPPQTTPTTIHE
jgi:hypothetical protein